LDQADVEENRYNKAEPLIGDTAAETAEATELGETSVVVCNWQVVSVCTKF